VLVDLQTYQARLELCQRCPSHFFWLGRLRCRQCGCFLGIKAKLSGMHCPLRYW
jgi:hypothetical protein